MLEIVDKISQDVVFLTSWRDFQSSVSNFPLLAMLLASVKPQTSFISNQIKFANREDRQNSRKKPP